jgi:hypothetical protein
MKEKSLCFILILILIGFVSAVQLRINPTKLDFNSNIGEKICNNLSIFSDYKGDITGSTKWSMFYSKDIKDYSLDAGDLGLKLEFSERIKVNNSGKSQVCIISKKSGEYYGALLYNTENSPAGVGIWLNVKINASDYGSSSKITGSVVDGSSSNISQKDRVLILCFIPTMLLSFMLVFLLGYYKKRKNAKYQ